MYLSRLVSSLLPLLCFCSFACRTPDSTSPAAGGDINEVRNLGLAFLEENRLDEAEAAFDKMTELAPDDPAGYANLGIVYLRRGQYAEAEEWMVQARARNPADPSISLNLAEIYEQSEQLDRARSILEDALDRQPDHVPMLFKRARLYAGDTDQARVYAAHLEDAVDHAPANIVIRLYYVESLVQSDAFDEALVQLAEVRQMAPQLPRESISHFEAAVEHLTLGNQADAARSVGYFHNVLRVTPYYQTGLRLLGQRTDDLVGRPVLVESPALGQSGLFEESGEEHMNADILDAMQFTDASQPAGLATPGASPLGATAFAMADFDGNAEPDLFVAAWDSIRRQSTYYLLRNEFGRFSDGAPTSGLTPSSTRAVFSLFGDYDNDTFLDLYIVNEGRNQLFRNRGDGTFEDVSARAGVDDNRPGKKAVFADLDHDGDLDVYVGRNRADFVYRNNMDGTFTEMGEAMGLAGPVDALTEDIDFGDFDNDGDLDVLVARSNGVALYANLRQGLFEDVTAATPLRQHPRSVASAVGDYNNDGFLDLFIAASDRHALYLNRGNNVYEYDRSNNHLSDDLANDAVFDARFWDFDNDGFLDLFLAGRRAIWYHNDGTGSFVDVTDRWDAARTEPSFQVAAADYNQDRDLDLFLRTPGGIQLIRNDGGHLNRQLTVQPRGLLSNNSKNNYYSIGAKIEVRAGDVYQTRVVTEPSTYFGLGQRDRADVIRIVFTNGVPQNIFRPGADQDLLEEQILKGSCPFLYTWDGSSYTFATDLLWRSALGMPLGIMGAGEMAYAPVSATEDYVLIPEGLLQEEDGEYRIQITAELWETPYFDEVKLLVVDHPDAVSIAINERFGPPEPEPLPIHVFPRPIPATATDHEGRDRTHALSRDDDRYVAPLRTTRYQGIVERHALVLTPDEQVDLRHAVLYLKGWIFPTDASINVALAQSEAPAPLPPVVQVRDEAGAWNTVIQNMGFPKGKNKLVRVDLRGKFLSEDPAVRILSTMQIYWDHAFFAHEIEDAAVTRTVLSPATADLHYRGFSALYRPSPFSPHLFDYDRVSTESKWLDLAGRYTRYGDVTPLVRETEDQYVIMNAGDELSVAFDARQAPDVPAGWTRRFILFTDGWVKDGDFNTAFGQTVEPLPFHEMSAYPYPPDEAFPESKAHMQYRDIYNTREVAPRRFD